MSGHSSPRLCLMDTRCDMRASRQTDRQKASQMCDAERETASADSMPGATTDLFQVPYRTSDVNPTYHRLDRCARGEARNTPRISRRSM